MKRIILFLMTLIFVAANGFAFSSISRGNVRERFLSPPPVCTSMVTNTSNGGPGSLAAAITFVNFNLGPHTICFNISGGGVHTIAPTATLPAINKAVTIDGYTQPGSSPNILSNGNNAVLQIEINGNSAGFSNGLTINSGGSGSTIKGLVVNGFPQAQIFVNGASGNTIQGNFIGTNATGTAIVASFGGSNGILVRGAANNVIGGANVGEGNLISGNGLNGVFPGPSGGQGILLNGTLNGGRDDCGTTPAPVTGTVIQGNLIGTDITGTFALGNTIGVYMRCSTSGTLLGGTTPGTRNLISGNTKNPAPDNRLGQGVLIALGAHDNVVQGNYIGTNITGAAAVPNEAYGVAMGYGVPYTGSFSNLIGGSSVEAGNVISGNGNAGVGMFQGSSGNEVQNNLVGTDVTGAGSLGNGSDGVQIAGQSFGNKVGGLGTGNTIAFNTRNGVGVFSGNGNLVVQNSIFSNGGLGIELFPNGVTANDPCDADVGANNLQNHPDLTALAIASDVANITGKLDSTPGTQFYIEFFANNSQDPSGYGEGKTFIGSTIVATDGSCGGGFTVSLAVPADTQSISATATDTTSGSTSEFSAWFATTATSVTSDINPSTYGQSVTFTATVSSIAGTPTGTVTFTDGTTVLGMIPVDGTGTAVFATSSLSNGSHSITATYNGDANFNGSTSSSITQIVFGYAAGGGSFVIGDGSAAVGANVTFWGSQWASLNTLSGGSAPSSFKGFADQTSSSPATCGGTWATSPGNSSNPPSAIPGYMAVIVASSASKVGSTVAGNTTQIVIVKTNPGYDSNPGHAGTGTVVAVLCQ